MKYLRARLLAFTPLLFTLSCLTPDKERQINHDIFNLQTRVLQRQLGFSSTRA